MNAETGLPPPQVDRDTGIETAMAIYRQLQFCFAHTALVPADISHLDHIDRHYGAEGDEVGLQS